MSGARAAAVPLAVLAALGAAAWTVRSPRRQQAEPTHVAPYGTDRGAVRVTAASGAGASVLPLRGASGRGKVREGAARMLHGDPRRTGRAQGRVPREARVAWKAVLGGPIQAQVVASPDERTLYAASLDGALTALARDTGETRWRVALGERAYAAPCVADDGTIYVGSDAKRFRAIDPKGTVLWAIETNGEADTAALLMPDGAVVFAAGNTVYAARRGGDVAWRFEAKGKVFTAPALVPESGLVVFGSQDDHVYAVRAASGQIAWSVDLGADVDGAPAVGDAGEIFVGTDGGDVVRLDERGGLVWRTNVGGFVRGALSVARNGDVLAGAYGPTPRQVRLDGATGAVRGAFSVQGTGAREFGVHGGAVEDDDGALVFGAQDDRVYALDATGSLRWKFPTGGDVDAPATLLSDGALVVGSDDGSVYILTP
jgi:outer membrane protein assembly factor BamB